MYNVPKLYLSKIYREYFNANFFSTIPTYPRIHPSVSGKLYDCTYLLTVYFSANIRTISIFSPLERYKYDSEIFPLQTHHYLIYTTRSDKVPFTVFRSDFAKRKYRDTFIIFFLSIKLKSVGKFIVRCVTRKLSIYDVKFSLMKNTRSRCRTVDIVWSVTKKNFSAIAHPFIRKLGAVKSKIGFCCVFGLLNSNEEVPAVSFVSSRSSRIRVSTWTRYSKTPLIGQQITITREIRKRWLMFVWHAKPGNSTGSVLIKIHSSKFFLIYWEEKFMFVSIL